MKAPRAKKPKRGFLDGYRTYEGERGSPDQWRDAFAERLGLEAAEKVVGKDDPRTILGVGKDATWAEIRSAYRRKAMETHPDRGGTAEAFRRVQAAYEVLESQVPH